MKKYLCLLGLFCSFVCAQEINQTHSYLITISDIKGSWSESIETTVDPYNIIESDFSKLTPLPFDCMVDKKQVTESVEGIFFSTNDYQELNLEITKVLNKLDLQKKGCEKIQPNTDTVSIRIGFPFLAYQHIVNTKKAKYVIVAKKK